MSKEKYNIDEFDLILMTVCDLQGVGRGRYVTKRSVPGFVKNGLGMPQVVLFFGIRCDIPMELSDYKEAGFPNGSLIPDVGTLKPLSWLSYGGKKVGHMLGDIRDQELTFEESSSREVARRQVKALETLGYNALVSQDVWFTVFHKNTLRPVGTHEVTSQLLTNLLSILRCSGLPVSKISRGFEPGKLQISLENQHGLEAADNLHRLHHAVRLLCAREGYETTSMTSPLADISPNGAHYSITLMDKSGRNAFCDGKSQSDLSSVGGHWVAGCLHHSAAVTGLTRPTLNCYTGATHLTNAWTQDELDRSCRLQVQASSCGPTIVDKLPSVASNPYIVLAAFLAAGMDGIEKKMEPPAQGKIPGGKQADNSIPASLEGALQSLEEDKALGSALGAKFVERFLIIKRVYEVNREEDKTKFKDNLEYERYLYQKCL